MFGSSCEPGAECWEPALGGEIAEASVPTLIAALGLRACWFESFPFAAQLPRIEPGRIVLPPEEPGVALAAGCGAVELPVRHCGLTLGRFVLVPASPTCGVALSPTGRAEAMALVAPLGARIAAAVVAERDETASSCITPASGMRGARRPPRLSAWARRSGKGPASGVQ